MDQGKSAVLKSAVTGWVKGIFTSVIGLISGALLIYVTPLVNNAIKPAKPLANFATHVSGLSVDFNNRSSGGTQGWWDFGDGSALEPFDPKAEIIKHVFAKPGTYSVKLSLTNLIGDESDRTAPVTLDTAAASDPATKPEIAAFDLIPVTPGECVPAVYKLQAKVTNASFCILSFDDERPMEIATATATNERYITFNQMGQYTVRFAAVNGTELVERTKDLYVGSSSGTAPMAKLTATYDAVQVTRTAKDLRVFCAWQAGANDSVSAVHKERLADPGCTIASATLANPDDPNAPIRNVKVEITPDKKKIILTGELVRSTGLRQRAANGAPLASERQSYDGAPLGRPVDQSRGCHHGRAAQQRDQDSAATA